MSDEIFEDFADVIPLPIESLSITPWYSGKNGTGQPLALLVVGAPALGADAPDVLSKLRFVMRFKSRAGLDAFVADLNAKADVVWSKA